MNHSNPWNLNWKSTVGLELTYISPNELKTNDDRFLLANGTTIQYYEVGLEMKEIHDVLWNGPKGAIDSDPGCVEWSTPVLHSWDEAKAAWEHGHLLAEMHDLIEEDENVAGGAGHIHVECKDKGIAHAILIDIFCRPYIAWAFCHPSAIRYCSPLHATGYQLVPLGIPILGEIDFRTFKYSVVNLHSQYPNLNFGTSHYSDSLEFRMFNMAPDWDTQYLHLAFVQRYVEYITEKIKKNGIMPCLSVHRTNNEYSSQSNYLLMDALKWNVHQAYAKDIDRCIKEFKELIEMLGLPWEHYEGFVEQNLRPQFAWGKRGRKSINVVSTRKQKAVLKNGAFDS